MHLRFNISKRIHDTVFKFLAKLSVLKYSNKTAVITFEITFEISDYF
jgi:hypothetical protein